MKKFKKSKNIAFAGESLFVRQTAGSHIPVLRAIPKKFDITSVLEFGTGIYSLTTFLDKKYYDKLEKITSIEKNDTWYEYMGSKYLDDRWSMQKECSYSERADLIFVDGPSEERKLVLGKMSGCANILVLHDYDTEYTNSQEEIDKYAYKFVYNPPICNSTAILSNTIDVSKIDWKIEWSDDFLNWKIGA